MKQVTAMLVGAGSRGAKAYAPYALHHPTRIKFVAIAEHDETRRNAFATAHNLPDDHVFTSYESMLEQGIKADVVFVCTQDDLHHAPAMMVLNKGYNLVLEKPIANHLAQCEEITATAIAKNLELVVCHVLRYTSFFETIKEIITSGEIGKVLSITLNENVGYAHAAHSYVRGNWRREDESSPMLLAKSCHDMDILYWLMGSKCNKVSSFGALTHFKPENAPAGSTTSCLGGCKVKETCCFDAEKIYMDPALTDWPVNVITADTSPEGRRKALKEGPYGRCVYHCDNTVVDHQVVNLHFENGATANFSMNSLSAKTCRTITVYGTNGQLTGTMEENEICKQLYGKQAETIQTQKPGQSEYGHGGGDYGLMNYVTELLGNPPKGHTPTASDAICSHRICFAAEQARHTDAIVTVD